MAKNTKNQFRPPIVTFVGHIDHGKTTLLDKIRTTHLWKKEAGGITQHIGAYQIQPQKQKTSITFIDTPGHAAFINMRRTGTQIADLVVLVISASQGVKAQTKECLKLIEKQQIPFIVAINKIDLPHASADKVKGQLVELGINPEDYGGQISCLPVSAKTGQGIDKLLEIINLNAEIMELKNRPAAPLQAFVIESKLDQSRGPVATLVVKQGTLKIGDQIYYQNTPVKVKALIDHTAAYVKQIGPGGVAQALGFTDLPPVACQITGKASPPTLNKENLSKSPPVRQSDKQLAVIIKADTCGTLQALLSSFTDDILLIHSGIGPVSDNDIFLAQSASAQIFAFNLKTPQFIQNLAKNQNIRIFESKIIYEIIDDINNQVLKILEPTIDETITGEGTIIAQFEINKLRIAGVKCTTGKLVKGDSIHLKRADEIIKNTKIDTIKQGKQESDQTKKGIECGISFKPNIDFKLDDVIISYYKIKQQ